MYQTSIKTMVHLYTSYNTYQIKKQAMAVYRYIASIKIGVQVCTPIDALLWANRYHIIA